MSADKYVAALDVGTTTIRCYIYDKNVQICGSASENVELLYPQPLYVEIDPDKLWASIVLSIENAIKGKKIWWRSHL